jgi:thioredoxin 1
MREDTEPMRELNENEYDGALAKGFTLIEFGAEWCGPCKALLPTMHKLSGEYAGKLNVYSVDIDKTQSIAMKNGVMSVPTLILYKDGKVVDRVVGMVSESALRKKIDAVLS